MDVPHANDNKAIRIASEHGNADLVRLLLADPRVDPTAHNNEAIRAASHNGYTYVVKLLLDDGRADPAAFNNGAIRDASHNGYIDVVRLLLTDPRVDPTAADNDAIRGARTEIVTLLLKDPRVSLMEHQFETIIRDLTNLLPLKKDIDILKIENYDSLIHLFLYPSILHDKLRFVLSHIKKISQGGMGHIYQFGKYVVKHVLSSRDDNKFYMIEYTPTHKTLLRIPNHLIEAVTSVVLSTYIRPAYTPSFMNTYACMISPNLFLYPQKPNVTESYTINELLTPMDPLLFGHITDESFSVTTFLFSVFQILFALHNAQQTCHFVHNDLHRGNVMLRTHSTYRRVKYHITENLFLYGNINRDTVIIDYGFARCETQHHIFTNVLDTIIGQTDSTDLFEYNPFIDVATFLIANINNKFVRYHKDIIPIFYQLLIHFFNIEDLFTNDADFYINDYLDMNGLKIGWRMKSYKLKELRIKPRSALDLISFLQNIIVQNITMYGNDEKDTSGEYRIPFVDNKTDILSLVENQVCFSRMDLDDHLFAHTYTNVNLVNSQKVSDGDKHNSYTHLDLSKRQPLDNSSHVYDILRYESTFPPFHISYMTDDNQTHLPKSHQKGSTFYGKKQMYMVRLNPEEAPSYKFKLDCCHIDTRTYLEDSRIDSGVCINAGFFNINSDFAPIGQSTIGVKHFNHNPIPFVYQPYYHQITIGGKNTNTIYINPTPFTLLEGTDDYFFSGPLLIREGHIHFDEDMLDTKIDDVYIFQCEPFNFVPKVKKGDSYVKNCNPPSQPGELFHAANKNSRSALVTTYDNQVYFVTTPGRMKDSEGMTLPEFARYISKIPNINMAVNLDGGGSSRITLKIPASDTILYLPSQKQAQSYHVGTILSFVKMRPDATEPMASIYSLMEPMEPMEPMEHFCGKRSNTRMKRSGKLDIRHTHKKRRTRRLKIHRSNS